MTVCVCTVGQTELRVHPLAVAALFGACIFGRLFDLLQAMLALTLHEAAHVVAAEAFGCQIRSVELQPFGGVARMDGSGLDAHAERCIAAAGPVASFIIAGVASLVCYFAPETGARIGAFLAFNLTLGTVNLLPALPLDGGRMMRSMLAGRMHASRALRITAWTGIVCGAGMLGLALVAALRHSYNLTLPVMGLFLLLAAAGELRAAQERQLASFLQKGDALRDGGGLDVYLLAAHVSMRGTEALRRMRVNRFNLIRVVDADMRSLGELDEGALMRGLARMGINATLGELLSFDRTQRL